MSQSKFEATDATNAGSAAASTAAAARDVLSNEFVNSGKSPVTGEKSESPKTAGNALSEGSAIKESAVEALKGAAKRADQSPGESIGNAIKDAIKNGIESGSNDRSPSDKNGNGRMSEKMREGSTLEFNHGLEKNFHRPVTDKDRASAKDSLAKGISDLVPEADKALLKQMQGAVIDGNVDQLKESLGKLAGDPAKMDKFLKELNGQLKREGAGVELTNDGKGNVLVYEKYGNTAVSINAKSGETTLRAIERQNDGSMLLKPGEIINRTPAEMMKNIGDEATRDMTRSNFHHHFDHVKPLLKGGGGNDNKLQPPGLMQKSMENLIPEAKRKEK
ncbi:MAG: hypothetical protein SGJ27_24340 [Candidatus Melainabacteria bacterium]|nr:hypothetical protein [Candidatus Melainabacteria bacterium]